MYFDGLLTYIFRWPKTYLWKLTAAVIETAALYIELLAFVPAVWMICRVGKGAPGQAQQEPDVAVTRCRALSLFAFLVGFYFVEDVVSAFMNYKDLPMASMGHLAHFLLLLDFAGFVLAHLYDPAKFEKLAGSLMSMFTDACAV